MKEIQEFLETLFPNLSEDLVSQLLEKLADVGVSDLNDLEFLEEGDLDGYLKPIQIRKLLKHAKGVFFNSLLSCCTASILVV